MHSHAKLCTTYVKKHITKCKYLQMEARSQYFEGLPGECLTGWQAKSATSEQLLPHTQPALTPRSHSHNLLH
jgi:hypothetical protein